MQASTSYWNSSIDVRGKIMGRSSHLLFILFFLLLQACAATHDTSQSMMNGVALESPRKPSEEPVMKEIGSIGANYVCLMPYGYLDQGKSELSHNNKDWQWWGERSEGIEQLILEAKAEDLGVMLKPHVWIGWGDYTGDLNFNSEQEQSDWNASYLSYILHYARLAEEHDVELLCIGTELCMQLNDDPQYWNELISTVKEVYKGKLTYASNWDCYQDFPFWRELDFIGIDAYFPITEVTDPDLSDALSGWKYWKGEMSSYVDSVKRPIILTEYGYRSKEGCLAEPWLSGTGEDGAASEDQQTLGYRALYETLWSEPWFGGGFLWKWHCKEHLNSERRAKDYTPQGKPVMEVIEEQYGSQFLMKEE